MVFIPTFVTDSVFIELQNKQIRTMDRKKMKRVALGALICAFSLSSCADKDVYQGGEGGNDKNTPLSPTEAFDFNMKQEVKVNVDYGFTNDYYIVFELYSQNPSKDQVLVLIWEHGQSQLMTSILDYLMSTGMLRILFMI